MRAPFAFLPAAALFLFVSGCAFIQGAKEQLHSAAVFPARAVQSVTRDLFPIHPPMPKEVIDRPGIHRLDAPIQATEIQTENALWGLK